VEDRRVQGCGLSSAGRQAQHVRPCVTFGKAFHQGLLPWKRAMTVDGSKKIVEVGRTQAHRSACQTAAEAEAGEPASAKEDRAAYILLELDDGMN